MKAIVKSPTIEVTPMTKFEYYNKIEKFPVQHLENKRINGYYCYCNGFEFWLRDEDFHKLFVIKYEN